MAVVSWLVNFILDIGVVTSGLIGLIVTLIILRMVKYRKYKLPPGPTAYPLIGNLLGMKGNELHRMFAEWSKQYGPVVRFYIGPQLNVVLNNTDVVYEALVKRQGDFAGRPTSLTLDRITDGGRSIVFGEGPLWHLHRKLSAKAIRHLMKGSSLEEKVYRNMKTIGDLISKHDGPLDPTTHVLSLVVNIIAGVCFNQSYDMEDDEFRKLKAITESATDGSFGNSGFFLEDLVPLLHHCPTGGFKNLVNAMEWFQSLIQKQIVQHRTTLDTDNIRDLTDALLVAQTQEDIEDDKEALSQITDRHIVQTLSDIFGAGIDTTRMTILHALKYMAAYPDVQNKVYEEIQSIVGPGNLPRISDKEYLSYTDAVIHEVLRLHPVAPLAIPHKTMCDTSVGGFDIPKGTQVFVNLWALHHDQDKWANVEVFRPERFLDEDGKMAPKPDSWLPFSAGRRVCLGEAVVKPELVMLLACFIQRFKLMFPDGVTPDMNDKYILLGLFPSQYEVIFEER